MTQYSSPCIPFPVATFIFLLPHIFFLSLWQFSSFFYFHFLFTCLLFLFLHIGRNGRERAVKRGRKRRGRKGSKQRGVQSRVERSVFVTFTHELVMCRVKEVFICTFFFFFFSLSLSLSLSLSFSLLSLQDKGKSCLILPQHVYLWICNFTFFSLSLSLFSSPFFPYLLISIFLLDRIDKTKCVARENGNKRRKEEERGRK